MLTNKSERQLTGFDIFQQANLSKESDVFNINFYTMK